MIRSKNRVTVKDLSIIDDISMVNVRIYCVKDALNVEISASRGDRYEYDCVLECAVFRDVPVCSQVDINV
jgi:hypothetical protein